MSKNAVSSKPIREFRASSVLSQLDSSMQTSASSDLAKLKRQPNIRKVNDFIVYYDEIISTDKQGAVVKAQKVADLIDESNTKHERLVVSPHIDPEKKIYACKIYETDRCSKDDLLRICKEININKMLESNYCLKHYQTTKTQNKIYIVHEYANCFQLDSLLKERGTLRQEEARIIMRQLVLGLKDLHSLKIVHRNLQPSSIILHFPTMPKLDTQSFLKKRTFLNQVNLTRVPFEVKISGFNLSTIQDKFFNDAPVNLSLVGTPIYMSPQMLSGQCQ